jgi:hypothetical protein
MQVFDLFNTDYERRISEGAVDKLEQRRIDDLNMKMDDLANRVKSTSNPEHKKSLLKAFLDCKEERDSYYKIKEGEITKTATGIKHRSTSAYGGTQNEPDHLDRLDKHAVNRADKALGVKFDREKKYQGGLDLDEGSMKQWLWNEAERMDRDAFVANAAEYGMSDEEAAEWWDSINGVDEAGIGQDIANKTEKMARATPPTQAGAVASTVKNVAKWLAGQGGPGKEGPTYEGDYGDYSAGATNPDGTASSQRQADRERDRLEYERKQKGLEEGPTNIEDRGEYDQEGDMAKDNIHTIVRNARELESVIGDNDNLPEWVQDKLANIKGMMTAVSEYMQTQQEREPDGQVAIAEKLKGLPSKKLGSARDAGKSVRKFRAQRGLEEAGTDSQWSKESDWKAIPKAKSGRPVDPRGEVTHLSDVARREAERKADQKKNSEKVNEYISMGSDKNYMEAEPYKNYKIYVRKKPFGNTGIYTAHTEVDRKEFMGKGPSQEEAVQAIRDRIDFVLNAQKKVTGSSTIDFNVKFATDLLADPRQTFYAKLENVKGQPKLIIAGTDIANDPELLAAGDFKRSALRNQVDDQGRATPLPGIPLTAKSLRAGDWIANGRYTVGNETTDSDGNRVFDLTYHSTAHTKSDKLRLNQPAFTLGTAREVDEGFQDFNKVEPYAVCLAGKPVKKFDYYEDARRFHDNWKKKLYREGDMAKAEKITLLPLGLNEAQTDYQKRRQRERDVDAGRPVTPLPKNPQTDYAKKRAKEKRELDLGEDDPNGGATVAIGQTAGGFAEEKTRLDPKCWTGKKIGNPKTKVKGGVRVNNCVPAEESVKEEAKHGLYYNVNKRKKAGTSRPANSPKAPTAQAWKDAAKTAKKESYTDVMEAQGITDPKLLEVARKIDLFARGFK